MYRESLSQDDRHLTERLESFGDVVFGFALSISALQLSIPAHASDLLATPFRWAVYGVTFSLVVAYWLRYHRIMSVGFRPQQIDLTVLYLYHAAISLLPFGLITFSRLVTGTQLDKQVAFLVYTGLVFTIAAAGVVLEWRGLRRAYAWLDDAERLRTWRAIVRYAGGVLILAAAIVADAIGGVRIGVWPLVLLPLVTRLRPRLGRVSERLFGRGTSAPSVVS